MLFKPKFNKKSLDPWKNLPSLTDPASHRSKGSMIRIFCNNLKNKMAIHRWVYRLCCYIPSRYMKMSYLQSFSHHLQSNASSRRIFIFLMMNFTFMFVEFIYGYLSNSLGLISDACHMLFDCVALAIGLIASFLGSSHAVIHTSEESKLSYTYGHGRIKVLSGFINAIFLVYIAISVFIEAFERILHPPLIHSEKVLLVSVLGLCVNLVGLYFFHDAHSAAHGHSHSHAHGHSHSHSHEEDSEGHCSHEHRDHNINALFVHVMADTLGSVGVIVSSSIIYVFDWTMADAICSLFIAILISLNVYPLLISTSRILLDRTPSTIVHVLKHNELADMLGTIPGIVGFRLPHFWECEPGRIIGTIHIQIAEKSPWKATVNTNVNSNTNVDGNEPHIGMNNSINSNNNMNGGNHHNNKIGKDDGSGVDHVGMVESYEHGTGNGGPISSPIKEKQPLSEQEILQQVSALLTSKWGIRKDDLTVQMERQEYLDRLDPVHHSVYSEIVQVTSTHNRHVL